MNAVSYTHLDVYKRQPLAQPVFTAALLKALRAEQIIRPQTRIFLSLIHI